jgi:hypothetical protein
MLSASETVALQIVARAWAVAMPPAPGMTARRISSLLNPMFGPAISTGSAPSVITFSANVAAYGSTTGGDVSGGNGA